MLTIRVLQAAKRLGECGVAAAAAILLGVLSSKCKDGWCTEALRLFAKDRGESSATFEASLHRLSAQAAAAPSPDHVPPFVFLCALTTATPAATACVDKAATSWVPKVPLVGV